MNSLELAKNIRVAGLDKKASNPTILDLRGKSDLCDFQVIFSAESDRQTKAICENIDVTMKGKGIRSVAIEGRQTGQWILIDYGPVIVHIFTTEVRHYYAIEELWANAERIN